MATKAFKRRRGSRGLVVDDFKSDGDLARAATRVWKAAITDSPCDNPNVDNVEARRLGFGLANIELAIKHQIRQLREHGVPRPLMSEIGLNDACEIVEALRTGRDHPIFRYINGLRAMSSWGDPTSSEVMRRAIVVGTKRAYRKAINAEGRRAQITDVEASQAVIDACKLKGGVELTRDQVRKWDWAFRQNKAYDLAAAWERDIVEKAKSRPEPAPLSQLILARGAYLMRDQLATARLFTTPTLANK